jgi:hypothetical protein
VIWSLVKKPGARYRWREELFQSLVYRRAYDELRRDSFWVEGLGRRDLNSQPMNMILRKRKSNVLFRLEPLIRAFVAAPANQAPLLSRRSAMTAR